MADEERSERTEPASQRRIKAAWEEGQIPVGRDLVSGAALACGTAALLMGGPALAESLVALTAQTLRALPEGGAGVLEAGLFRPIAIVLAGCAAAALAAAAATFAQTQGNFWPNLAMPDAQRLIGGGRLGKLFSRETLVDMGLSLAKTVALAAVLWHAAHDEFLTLGKLLMAPASAQLSGVFAPLSRAAGNVLLTVAVIAGVDLAVQRHRFMSRMKMTKEEAKREYREEEGDPLLRSRRRRRHRELAKGRAAVEVPKADALVVNPTHIAIAIRYRKGESKAPRVTAKGKGALAEHMRELARANGIPIVEDIPLARLLWRRVKVGREVPMETYKAVAAILAFVYRLTGRSLGAAA
ncbi:MAG: EscU/YscU/HrcU family type III secretion system export apparatus switch protein [Deltaproteobacteria bacterium]|nr:EscU/YscU/HrcU family type III secretion system export apparatus switch protein [Deltaproteobacteria bacterium]